MRPMIEENATEAAHATPGAPQQLGPEETVWEGGPSQWQNIGWWIASLLVIFLPVAIYKAIKTATTDYTLTNQRLRIKTGILSRQTEEIELYRVRDTAVRQSLFERLFGLGTIHVSSSDPRTPEQPMPAIKDPHGVREHFRKYTEQMRRSRGVRDIDIS
ncbi:MAG: hypothetical protein CMJ31_10255 [Phycisphaerae bacterium]|nr:hypothetical protein [Phycisphaerae bacterium]